MKLKKNILINKIKENLKKLKKKLCYVRRAHVSEESAGLCTKLRIAWESQSKCHDTEKQKRKRRKEYRR